MELQAQVLDNHARQLGYGGGGYGGRGGYGGHGGYGRRMWCFKAGYGHGGGYGHAYRRMEVIESELEPLNTNEIAEDGTEADRKLGRYGYGRRGRHCAKYRRLLCCKRRHRYHGGHGGHGGGY